VRDSIPRVVCHATHVAVVVSVKSAAARSAPSCGARWEGGNVSAIVAFATCSKQLGIKGTWAHGRVCVRVRAHARGNAQDFDLTINMTFVQTYACLCYCVSSSRSPFSAGPGEGVEQERGGRRRRELLAKSGSSPSPDIRGSSQCRERGKLLQFGSSDIVPLHCL